MRKVALALLVSLFLPGIVAAQNAPTMYYVHEEIARPSMLGPYEATTKEFGAMMRANNQALYFNAFSTSDFHYYFVSPIRNFADVDRMLAVFPAVAQKEGAKFADLMRRNGATLEYTNEWVVRQRDDLSYMPAQPRVPFETARAHRFDFYFLQPGTEMNVEAIAKAWQSAMKAKELKNGFVVYEAVMGPELPAVIVHGWGNSPADIATADMQDMEKLGDQFMALTAQTFAGVRRFETKYAMSREDLSNLPPSPAKK